MARITYITPDEEVVVVDATRGTLMSVAVANQVKGIEGECGGVCSCATCHIHIDADWLETVGPPGRSEAALLELDDRVCDASRLGCQISIGPELDGLTVRVVGQ